MKRIFLFLAFVLIIAVACKQEAQVGTGFIGGTDGLEMSFVEDAPPDKVYNTPFYVNVLLKNVGEWDINNPKDVRITVSGISPADYGVSEADLTQNSPSALFARKRDPTGTIIEGSIANVNFPVKGALQYKGELPTDITATIKAEACYKYGTKALSNICIKKDLSSRDPSICLVNSDRKVSNSGAPVQITSIKESQAGTDSVLLTIQVSHVGTGTISEVGSDCSNAISKKDRVKFKIEAMSGISCSGLENPTTTGNSVEGTLMLFGGTRQITCTQPTKGEGDFEKPIAITLQYDYNEFISKTITIKKV